MESSRVARAVEAAGSIASAQGVRVDDAVIVHNSDRIAVRLVPADVLARVGPSAHQAGFQFEAEVARRLADTDSPVGELDPRAEPRVYMRDDFAITLWTYYQPVASPEITATDYAHTLIRLHAGFRQIDLEAPHLSDRIASARSEIGDRQQSPELPDANRDLLSTTLKRLSAAFSRSGAVRQQLLHGEPHPGNLLSTRKGPLFIDLGGCCRGPVEFDLAYAPEEVAEHYPEANHDLIRQCRILMWVFFTSCRWRRDDQLPNRDYWRAEGLTQLRAALDRAGLDLNL
jgi:Phosphotransferase enzyme family